MKLHRISFQTPYSVGVENFFEVRFHLIMLCSVNIAPQIPHSKQRYNNSFGLKKALKALGAVSKDIIEKSILVCGQSKNTKWEDIECLKKGQTYDTNPPSINIRPQKKKKIRNIRKYYCRFYNTLPRKNMNLLTTYICTERIFDSRLFIFNKLKKLL